MRYLAQQVCLSAFWLPSCTSNAQNTMAMILHMQTELSTIQLPYMVATHMTQACTNLRQACVCSLSLLDIAGDVIFECCRRVHA